MNETWYAAVRFVTELMVASALYTFHLPCRKRFCLRFFLCVLINYGLSLCWTLEMSQNIFLSVARYLLLFLSTVVLIYSCFKISFRGALFCGISAYSTQRFLVCFYDSFEELLLGKMTLPWFIFLYILFLVVIYVSAYFIFAKRMKDINYATLSGNDVLLMGSTVLICMVFLSVLTNAYGKDLPLTILAVLRVYSVVCSGLVLCFQFGMFQKGQLRKEIVDIRYLWNMEKKQYKFSKETIDLINVKYHDLKKQIACLTGRIPDKEIEALKEKVSLYEHIVHTGNEILDVVLIEKSFICESRKIRFHIVADGKLISFMEEMDIYSLFGNALDNAIEAVSEIEENQREIRLTLRKTMGLISISVVNGFQGELRMDSDGLRTSKGNPQYHGFGMKSIRMVSEKYRGTVTYHTRDQQFYLSLLFPVEP